MKVLHLLASPYFSGPAESVLALALGQRAAGHQVEVAIDSKRTKTPAEELGAPRFEAAGLRSELPLELSVKSNPLAMARDVFTLRSLNVDVVHCHFSHDHLLVRLASPRATVVRSIHAPRSLSRTTPRAQGWTVPTAELARSLVGAPVEVLPPMLGAEYFAPHSPPEPNTIGMVSTFQPSRRHDVALDAFALLRKRVPTAKLVLVGDGVLEPALRASVVALGLSDAVEFAGYKTGAEYLATLRRFQEVWVLGLGNDFAGRAAAQARAVGARVVAVDEGALSRWADVIAQPTPQSVSDVALGAERRAVSLENNDAIVARVLAMYERARAT